MAETTFSIAAGADDGDARGSGASYPPAATSAPSTAVETYAIKWLNAGTYYLYVPMFRFDTSSLADSAIISAATLRLYVLDKGGDADNRSLSAGWYAGSNWPIDTSDYTTVDQTDAHSGTDLTGISFPASLDLALTNLSNIDKTGYTGLRLTITGGAPTGANNLTFATLEHATQPEAQLIVTYTLPSLLEPRRHDRNTLLRR